MKALLLVLGLASSPVWAHVPPVYDHLVYNQDPTLKASWSRSSNLEDILGRTYAFDRTVDVPTHIVRMEAYVDGMKLKCEEVVAQIANFFTKPISSEEFYYNIITYCGYNPDTGLAFKFAIHSYFDPMTDGAVAFLKTYLAEHEGQNLLGSKFHVEEAQGLAVSLNVEAGRAQDEYANTLLRLREDHQSLYFPTHYEMLKLFTVDMYKNFYSSDLNVIMPFFNRWFYAGAGPIYASVLSRSDFVLLRPELMFLMGHAPKVYTSPLHRYFAHDCRKKGQDARCL